MIQFAVAKNDRVFLSAVSGFQAFVQIEEACTSCKKTEGEAKAALRPAEGSNESQTECISVAFPNSAGYAADSSFAESVEERWLTAHASEYSFIIRYPSDKTSVAGCGSDRSIFYPLCRPGDGCLSARKQSDSGRGFSRVNFFTPAVSLMKGNTYCYKYTVPDGFSGTVYDYLRKKQGYSTRLIRTLMASGTLMVNGACTRFKTPCAPFSLIEVHFAEEKANFPVWEKDVEILYEDDDIIILNKPAGIVVHPTKSHQEKTLANAVYHHFRKTGFPGIIRFINRIDMDTSGIVAGAKNKYAHAYVQEQFADSETEKYYYALVSGTPSPLSGLIDLPIGRQEDSPQRAIDSRAKPSQTVYETLEQFPESALLKVRILTGRTHQIRVHLRAIGCPILGDSFYDNPSALISRQALHAASLSFIHPRTKKRIAFSAPLPDDMDAALAGLRKKTDLS